MPTSAPRSRPQRRIAIRPRDGRQLGGVVVFSVAMMRFSLGICFERSGARAVLSRLAGFACRPRRQHAVAVKCVRAARFNLLTLFKTRLGPAIGQRLQPVCPGLQRAGASRHVLDCAGRRGGHCTPLEADARSCSRDRPDYAHRGQHRSSAVRRRSRAYSIFGRAGARWPPRATHGGSLRASAKQSNALARDGGVGRRSANPCRRNRCGSGGDRQDGSQATRPRCRPAAAR